MIRGGVVTLALGVLLAVLSTGREAQAQGEGVRLSAFQLELDKKAAEAYLAGDYAKAITLYETSLGSGEANITYLSLGRALFKAGRCQEADQALDKVLTAPKVPRPTGAEVIEALERYRREMVEQCGGRLRIVCPVEGMAVRIGQGPSGPCPVDAVTMAPGTYEVVGALFGVEVRRSVEVEALGLAKVTLELDPGALLEAAEAAAGQGDHAGALALFDLARRARPSKSALLGRAEALVALGRCEEARGALAEIPDGLEPSGRDHQRRLEGALAAHESGCGGEAIGVPVGVGEGGQSGEAGDLEGLGWLLSAVGGAAIVSGLVIDVALLGPTFDDLEGSIEEGNEESFDEEVGRIELFQAVNIALFLGGGALVATGLVMVLLGEPEQEPSTRGQGLSFGAWWGVAGGGGVELKGWW